MGVWIRSDPCEGSELTGVPVLHGTEVAMECCKSMHMHSCATYATRMASSVSVSLEYD